MSHLRTRISPALLLSFVLLIAEQTNVALADVAFAGVDNGNVEDQLPKVLKKVPKEVVRRRLATFDFGDFSRNIVDRGDQPVRITFFDDLTITAKTEMLVEKEGTFVWRARPNARFYGHVHLAFTKTAMFGVIQVDTTIIEIVPIRKNVVLISESDQRKYPPDGPAIRKSDRLHQAQKTRHRVLPGVSSGSTIKVLIVLPKPTYSWLCSGFGGVLLGAIYETNLNTVFDAVMPTGVSASVMVRCYDYSPVGGDLADDLNWIRTDVGIAALRNAVNADLVCLIVPDGDYCGLAYENYPLVASDEAYGFSVVRRSCAIGNYSLAHELGHNLGMRHDRAADGAYGESTCNYGYVFPAEYFGTATTLRSVMAYGSSCGSCTRIGVYSNPTEISLGPINIGPMGVSCGTPASSSGYDRADNRQQLIDAAPVVAAFR